MRPLRPFCGTVLKAQLLTLPATISTRANGVVTTQLSFLPPASSTATDVSGSSDSRPATVQPPEPAAHHHEVECIRHAYPPGFLFWRACEARFGRPKLGFCGGLWQERFREAILPSQTTVFAVIKSSKERLFPFPKQGDVDTYRSRPMASARVAFSGSLGTGSIGVIWRSPGSFPAPAFRRQRNGLTRGGAAR